MNRIHIVTLPFSFLEALKIIAVVPSTSSSCERPVSFLRRLKDDTQSTMKSDRFNGLTSMYTHSDIYINPSTVQKKILLTNLNSWTNFRIVDWFRKVWNIIVIFILLLLFFLYLCLLYILQQFDPLFCSYCPENEVWFFRQ